VRGATRANRRLVRCLGLASLALCVRPAGLLGQGATTATLPMPGFAAARAPGQRVLEDAAVQRLNADSARAHSRALSAETHVAGTAAQLRTRDYVLEQMRAMGLRTEVRSYSVFMPHAVSVRLWRTAPTERELPLGEPPVVGDSTSATWQYPTVNGYSGAGEAAGEVVYVNYGLIEDYARLDSLGVSVAGRIAVARYGRSFRGIKAREAERHGAAALIIYSDPQGDGYVRGDVYPEGPMRSWNGVQRGSVFNGAGDPATPGYASTANAPRLAVEGMAIPRIPVIPISYANASELLAGLRGRDVPAGWQGGLPFHYHIGPGPVRARVLVTDDRATQGTKQIHNTFGIVVGSELPDELVILGAHRDAWGPGAADNVSGTVSVLESARILADAVRAGHRPRRTIMFATWDAEEWGLLGSTEYVEDDSLRLTRGAVAYLNQDAAAEGARFGAGGSPSLRALLRDVARRIPDPNGRGSIFAEWQRASAIVDTTSPPMTDPGGGSVFPPF
jgi:N-acetylated-alpha-linked acidic dipeptidase